MGAKRAVGMYTEVLQGFANFQDVPNPETETQRNPISNPIRSRKRTAVIITIEEMTNQPNSQENKTAEKTVNAKK